VLDDTAASVADHRQQRQHRRHAAAFDAEHSLHQRRRAHIDMKWPTADAVVTPMRR